MTDRQRTDLEFETRASLSSSDMATGVVLATIVVALAGIVAIHILLSGPGRVALDTSVLVAGGAFLVIEGRSLVRRLPRAQVYADRVTGLVGASPVVWFRDVTGYRSEVERYGFGPWNTEHVLWLHLSGGDVRIGWEWSNHRELQAQILQRIGLTKAASRPWA